MSADPGFYFSIAAFFLIFALVIFIVVRKWIKEKKILGRLSKAVGALESGSVMIAVHEGIPYRYYYFPGSKNSPPSFTITIDCLSSGEFEISRESRLEGFFKNIGISREIQTGDREFDRDFYILADSEAFALPMFAVSEKRQAVREIFQIGFTSIRHDGKEISAVWSPFKLEEDLDPSHMTKTVSYLATLAKEMPVLPRSVMFLGRPKWKAKRATAFAAPLLLLAAGISSLLIGLSWFKPLDEIKIFFDSLRYSLPLLALFLWLAVSMIKGRSSSHKELIWIIGLCLVSFPLSGFGLEMFLNGWLDSSSATTHTVRVTDKYVTRSKDSTSYYVLLDSWRRRGGEEKLEVPSSLYREIAPRRSSMIVVTKPGRYGFEWIVTYSVATTGRDAKGSEEQIYANLKRGFDFYKQSNFDRAIGEYNKAIELGPGNAEAYYLRGIAYVKKGPEDKALADFKKSIELDPIRIEAYQYLDWILARRGQWDEIIASWTKLIALQPNNGKAYLERGGAYFHKGDLRNALRDAEKSCSLGYNEGCRIYDKFKNRLG